MEKVDYIALHDIIFVMFNFYLALRDHCLVYGSLLSNLEYCMQHALSVF